MSEQKVITVKLTSTSPIDVGKIENGHGWGDRAQEIELTGEVAQIQVKRDGKSTFSIRILENGNLILTSYDTFFTQMVSQNLRLENGRPWE